MAQDPLDEIEAQLDVEQQHQRFNRWRRVQVEGNFREPKRAVVEIDGGEQEYRVDLAALAAIKPGTPEFMAKYVPPPDPEVRVVGMRGPWLIVEGDLDADDGGVGSSR